MVNLASPAAPNAPDMLYFKSMRWISLNVLISESSRDHHFGRGFSFFGFHYVPPCCEPNFGWNIVVGIWYSAVWNAVQQIWQYFFQDKDSISQTTVPPTITAATTTAIIIIGPPDQDISEMPTITTNTTIGTTTGTITTTVSLVPTTITTTSTTTVASRSAN